MQMKKESYCKAAVFAAIILFYTGSAVAGASARPPSRSIDPIVSTEWLANNGGLEDLVVIDVRPDSNDCEDYSDGHIPGAISVPFDPELPSIWITMRDGLLLEFPEPSELFADLGAIGIDATSRVVVVSSPNPAIPAYGLAAATRVALTLIWAGVTDVAILDGGYPKWVAEGNDVTQEVPSVTPILFEGAVNDNIIVSKEEVRSKIWRANIIDARDADVYYGATVEPFAGKAGHIPGSVSLPAPWIWDSGGGDVHTYKDLELLNNMASGVLRYPMCRRHHGGHRCSEVIVYCGVGGYASAWWYVLTQVLGYRHVKFYDGSAQEWSLYYDMVPYQWY
jgi:thiosulfate/3-mercaptopyruvate sulfurtransferase